VSRKLIVNDGRRERELVLVGPIVVGRDPMCDISEADPLLSRRHAEFSIDGTAIVVRDLGSRNGIYVNGAKRAETRLRTGDLVQIGNLQLRYIEDATPIEFAPELADVDSTGVIHSSAVAKSSPSGGSAVRPAPSGSSPRPAPAASTPGAPAPKPGSAGAPAPPRDEELTAFVPPPSEQGPAGLVKDSASRPARPVPPSEDLDKTSLVAPPSAKPAPRAADPAASAAGSKVRTGQPASAPVDDVEQTRIMAQPARSGTSTIAPTTSIPIVSLPVNREAHALSLAVGAIADFLGATAANARIADAVNALQQDLAQAADEAPGTRPSPVRASAKEIVDEVNRLMARLRTASSDLS